MLELSEEINGNQKEGSIDGHYLGVPADVLDDLRVQVARKVLVLVVEVGVGEDRLPRAVRERNIAIQSENLMKYLTSSSASLEVRSAQTVKLVSFWYAFTTSSASAVETNPAAHSEA
jgi:hypothetical protein